MADWRDRMATMPLWAVFIYSAIVFGPVMGFLGTPGPHDSRWAAFAIRVGLLLGLVCTIAAGWVRRRELAATGAERLPDPVGLEHALRTGEAPTDTSLDPALLVLIPRRHAQLDSESKLIPWLGVGAGLGILFAIVYRDRWSLLWGALLVASPFWTRAGVTRRRQRLSRLETTVRERATQ